MKTNRFFILVAFALFVMLPFSVNAEEFKNGDTKYFIEKQNVTCEIDGQTIDLDALYEDDDWEVFGPTEKGNDVFLSKSNDVIVIEGQECITFKYDISLSQKYVDYILEGFSSPTEMEYYIDDTKTKIVLRKTYDFTTQINNEYYIHVPSTKLDKNSIEEYYSSDGSPLKNYLEKEGKNFDDIQNMIDETPIMAIEIFTKLGANDYTEEVVMTIENEEVKAKIEALGEYVFLYDYAPEHKVAYFIDYTADQINGKPIFDSNGNFYSFENMPFHHSGDLIWGWAVPENAYVVLDEDGNVIHKINSVQVDSNVFLGNYYVPFHELGYDNYVYDFYINVIRQNNRYKIYEYKLLSEDNRVIDGKTDFVTKFSGLYDRVKSVKVDTNELDMKYVTSGSTIVTLDAEYLNALSDGKHTITVEYKDGVELTSTFTINKNLTPVYDVIFDSNGGIFKNGKTTIEIEDIINFNYDVFEKPIRDGYKFVGFYTEKTGGKSYLNAMGSETGIEEGTIFYARWEVNEENPKTFDGIGTSIFMGTISLIGLAGATIYLRKKNKVRAN